MSSFLKIFLKAMFQVKCLEGRAKWGHQVRKQDSPHTLRRREKGENGKEKSY
jgi:hypothetical protein